MPRATLDPLTLRGSVVLAVRLMDEESLLACAAYVVFNPIRAAGAVEEDLWLCPIEDRRREGSLREGLLVGFSLDSHLLLIDYTSRLCRQGKVRISREVASILDRLGTSSEVWGQRIQRLLAKSRLLGSYFGSDPERLRQLA